MGGEFLNGYLASSELGEVRSDAQIHPSHSGPKRSHRGCDRWLETQVARPVDNPGWGSKDSRRGSFVQQPVINFMDIRPFVSQCFRDDLRKLAFRILLARVVSLQLMRSKECPHVEKKW